jgi:hypothetical protein
VLHAQARLRRQALDVFTIQTARWRLARNRDITVLDTTVKTGTSIFAPTWNMVMGIKNGDLTWDEYTKHYWERMNASWKSKDRSIWIATLKETEPLAIACFCRYEGLETHCHRFLLKDLFEKLCAREGIPFLYYGELTE